MKIGSAESRTLADLWSYWTCLRESDELGLRVEDSLYDFHGCCGLNAGGLVLGYSEAIHELRFCAMISTPNKSKYNPMLMKVALVSVLLHVIAGFVAGVVTIATHIMKEEAQFEEPPAAKDEQPPVEVKVQIRQQAPAVKMPNQLRMKPVANIAVASVTVDLPSMSDSFTVSAGLGGLGGVNLLGGARGNIGLGISDVSVFGLKTRAERVLFVVEASRRMVLDKKGGLNSYRVIKDEISGMVENLSAGTLFNVMLFQDGRVKLFRPRLVAAGVESSQQLKAWFAPVNSDLSRIGIRDGKPALIQTKVEKYPRFYEGMRAHPTNQAVIQTALEMNVDAIFQIAGDHEGFMKIRWKNTPEEVAAAKAKRETWLADPNNSAQFKAHEAEVIEMQKRVKQAHEKHNVERAKKGLPPKVLENHLHNNTKYFGLTWKTQRPDIPPPHPPHLWQDETGIRRYYHELMQQLYYDRNIKPPSINVILFLAGDEQFPQKREDKVKRFTSYFKGKYRILRGENEIRMASSAKNTQQ